MGDFLKTTSLLGDSLPLSSSPSQRILFHLEGFSGSGKTTVLLRLEKEFPEITFKDMDDFFEEASRIVKRRHNIEYFCIRNISTSAEYLLTHFTRLYGHEINMETQQLIDEWLAKQHGDIIFVGIAYLPPCILQTEKRNVVISPSAHEKYLLNTPPLQVAWRWFKREFTLSTLGAIFLLLLYPLYQKRLWTMYRRSSQFNTLLIQRGYIPCSYEQLSRKLHERQYHNE
jgi:hypothetical protein